MKTKFFGVGLVCMLMLSMVFMSGCTEERKSNLEPITDMESEGKINLTNETEAISKGRNEPEKQGIIEKIFSIQIKSNSKDLLPTLEHLETGWELVKDEAKNVNDWSIEDQNRVGGRGFIEGHYRTFKKGAFNLAGLANYQSISFSISLYSMDGIKEVIEAKKQDTERKEYFYNETYEDQEYNEKNQEFETVNKTRELRVGISKLKNPDIGEGCVMWCKSESNSFFGEVKRYYITFIKKNVFVEVSCTSLDTQKAIENCIKQAKFVDSKI